MEPTPPELGATTGSPHGLVVEGREELLYLLGEAAEVEHAACCVYLYAAFTLRAEPGAGLTAAQVPAVAGWKRTINQIALQEMIHLALVNNLLAALGGAPRLGRHNLPQRSPYAPEIRLTLAPFSEQTLRSSIAGQLEETGPPPPTLTGPLVLPAPQAFSSVGQLYRGIERGLHSLVDRYGEGQVFVGSPNAQASTRYFRVPDRMPELSATGRWAGSGGRGAVRSTPPGSGSDRPPRRPAASSRRGSCPTRTQRRCRKRR
jgi:hypothetical protein